MWLENGNKADMILCVACCRVFHTWTEGLCRHDHPACRRSCADSQHGMHSLSVAEGDHLPWLITLKQHSRHQCLSSLLATASTTYLLLAVQPLQAPQCASTSLALLCLLACLTHCKMLAGNSVTLLKMVLSLDSVSPVGRVSAC